jgi:hypothetical protein
VGLASLVMSGEEDRELTFKVEDGATGSGTVTGVRDDDGGTTDSVKAKGGVSNRVGAMGSGMVQWGRGRRQGRGRRRGHYRRAARLKAASAMGLARRG